MTYCIFSSGWTRADLQSSTASRWAIKSWRPTGSASMTSPIAMQSKSWRATLMSCWPSGWETFKLNLRWINNESNDKVKREEQAAGLRPSSSLCTSVYACTRARPRRLTRLILDKRNRVCVCVCVYELAHVYCAAGVSALSARWHCCLLVLLLWSQVPRVKIGQGRRSLFKGSQGSGYNQQKAEIYVFPLSCVRPVCELHSV